LKARVSAAKRDYYTNELDKYLNTPKRFWGNLDKFHIFQGKGSTEPVNVDPTVLNEHFLSIQKQPMQIPEINPLASVCNESSACSCPLYFSVVENSVIRCMFYRISTTATGVDGLNVTVL
jgi:hypothetical protein